MKKTTKNIHKFIIPKSAGGHYDIRIGKIRGSSIDAYIPSQRLSRTLGRIYDLNEELIRRADDRLGKEQFKNKIIAVMKEQKRFVNPKTAEVSYKDRTISEALRIVSRSRIFTTKEEQALENFRKNINRKDNEKIRNEVYNEWADIYHHEVIEDGKKVIKKYSKMPWKKIVWDKDTKSFRMIISVDKETGKQTLSKSGIKFLEDKKGKYRIGEQIFEFVDVV